MILDAAGQPAVAPGTALGSDHPTVSIIIVNWNTQQLLGECLGALQQNMGGLSYDVWVVDNASTDGSVAFLHTQHPWVHVIESEANLGFAKANNLAMRASSGHYMLLLNSDAFVTSDAVQRLVCCADDEARAAIVGAHLLNPDGSFQASHTRFPTLFREWLILSGIGRKLHGEHYPSAGPDEEKGRQCVDYVEGACMLVRRTAFEAVGGLDEGYFMYAEEVDWCYSMRVAGWQVWYEPRAKVIHIGGASSTGRRTRREADLYRSRIRFFRKHKGNLAAEILKLEIIILTAAKNVLHRVLRLLTGNRKGRQIVGLRELAASLRGV